jgi:hypothetical protein
MVRALIASAAAVLAGVIAVLVATRGTEGTPGSAATQGSQAPQGSQATQPTPTGGPWLAPYDFLGAAGPSPAEVMRVTGIRRFTLAFIASEGACNPAWRDEGPLTGGRGEAIVRSIRSAGGEVAVSFGGMGGTKLGLTCASPEALAGAYQKVISAFRLRAIDLDIEDTEIASHAARQRIISALAIVRQRNPVLMISVTIAADSGGPDASGRDLISQAAASGLRVDAWTIMPFDFAGPGTDMGQASVQAAEGLKNDLMSAYQESASAAYATMGISSMNGRTDTGELVSVADFRIMLRYVQAHHLARFAFWSLNRDRSCTPGSSADSCSGIAQEPYAFTRTVASYQG